jgi:RND family efflux transporter MFP subunit
MTVPFLHGPALALLIAAAIAVPGTASAEAALTLSAAQRAAAGVELAAPRPATASTGPGYPARIEVFEHDQHFLTAPAAGVVVALMAELNTAVSKGQVMAELRSGDLAQAQRDYLVARDAAALANAEAARDAGLVADGIIAEKRRSASRSAAAQAQAMMAERRQGLLLLGLTAEEIAALETGRRITDRLQLRSPSDGVVLSHGPLPGQRIDGSSTVYTIADLSLLLVEIEVPQGVAAAIRAGATVALDGVAAAGRVESVGAMVNDATQTVTVRARFDNRDGALRPGSMATARFVTATENAAWQIPRRALVHLDGQPNVFVQDGESFRPVPVQLLTETAEQAVVAGPLAEDASVVARGALILKGMMAGLGAGE